MKIGIIGASGKSGLFLTKEALLRGYKVVAIVRNKSKMPILDNTGRLSIKIGDLTNKKTIINIVKETNITILISAYGPSPDSPEAMHDLFAENLITIMKECPTLTRLFVIGGAGSLLNNDNEIIVETKEFPAEWKADARKQVLALEKYRNSDINWTYFSPSLYYEPDGIKTSKFKLAENKLIVDKTGKSHISYADAAIAVIDEIKNHKYERKRFTAGYDN